MGSITKMYYYSRKWVHLVIFCSLISFLKIEFCNLNIIVEVCLSYSVSCVWGKRGRNDTSAPPLYQVRMDPCIKAVEPLISEFRSGAPVKGGSARIFWIRAEPEPWASGARPRISRSAPEHFFLRYLKWSGAEWECGVLPSARFSSSSENFDWPIVGNSLLASRVRVCDIFCVFPRTWIWGILIVMWFRRWSNSSISVLQPSSVLRCQFIYLIFFYY